MEKAITAADANRKFSQVLREVKEGQSYVVTSHGNGTPELDAVDFGSEKRPQNAYVALYLSRSTRRPSDA